MAMGDSVILIVDDNDVNVKLARDVLRFGGFQTLEASTAGAGLALASQHLPDLVLMDIRLPDMEGTEAVRKLKADSRTAAIPVVALTSFAMKGDRETCIEAGASDYISKPVDTEQLLSLLRVWLYR